MIILKNEKINELIEFLNNYENCECIEYSENYESFLCSFIKMKNFLNFNFTNLINVIYENFQIHVFIDYEHFHENCENFEKNDINVYFQIFLNYDKMIKFNNYENV